MSKSLEDCILYAIEHSPALKSTRLSEQATDYEIASIRSQALPQINATGNYSYNYALAEQILPGEFFGEPGTSIPVKFGVAHSMSSSLEISQQLYSKSLKTNLAAAKASQELTKDNIFQATENLIYDVIQVYLQINLTQRQIGLIQDNIGRIERLISISEIQFEEGLIKKIDVDQLRVNRTNLQSEHRNLDAALQRQMNLLKFFMGMKSRDILNLAPYDLEDESYSLVDELIISENTSLSVLEKQAMLMGFNLENVKAGFYPSVSAFANYGWQGQTDKLFSSNPQNKLQGSPTGLVGLRLSIPIFDGFQRKNTIEKIKIEQDQLALERENLINSIEMQFDNANLQLEQNKMILEAQLQNMTLAESLYEASKLSYQEGVAPLTELLNAETSLQEAQTQFITALLNVKLAELDHLQTSGQLTKLIKESLSL